MTAPQSPLALGRHRRQLSALAVGAMVALTGCASLHPGAAAVVGSETITQQEVDDLAEAICAANISGSQAQGQPAPELATRGARFSALQVLVDTALSQQFGEKEGVDPNRQQVSQAIAENEESVALLPEDMQEGFRAVIEQYVEAQLMLMEAGRQALGGDVSDEEATAEGQRLRAAYVTDLEIEVDPRYGTYTRGAIQPGAASLSVPASDDALAGARVEPAPAWVSSLPASQKCT